MYWMTENAFNMLLELIHDKVTPHAVTTNTATPVIAEVYLHCTICYLVGAPISTLLKFQDPVRDAIVTAERTRNLVRPVCNLLWRENEDNNNS